MEVTEVFSIYTRCSKINLLYEVCAENNLTLFFF